MTHNELELELARATGESVATIRRRGFNFFLPDQQPLTVDWDELEAERMGLFPARASKKKAV